MAFVLVLMIFHTRQFKKLPKMLFYMHLKILPLTENKLPNTEHFN